MKKLLILSISVSVLLTFSSCASLFAKKFKDLPQENNCTTNEDFKKSCVKVTMTTKTNSIGISYIQEQYGSGVIFYEDSNKYYALTNNHVLYKAGLGKSNYYVTDSMGNQLTASIVKKSSSLDLAVVSFKKEALSYPLAKISETNAPIGSYTQAIDENFVFTTGKITGYEPAPKLANAFYGESNVKTTVITSDTYVHHGSSGGAFIDENYNVIGIVYASSQYSNGTFISSYIIPCEEVIKFLKDNKGVTK